MRKSERNSELKFTYQEDSEYELSEDRKEQKNRQKVYSKWTKDENIEYARFLMAHLEEFDRKDGRRSLYFFNLMASTLQNGRNNQQCRSHHQKMEKKFKTVEAIVFAFLKCELPPRQKEESSDLALEKTESSEKEGQFSSTDFLTPKSADEEANECKLKLYNDEDFWPEQDSNLFGFCQASFDFFMSWF